LIRFMAGAGQDFDAVVPKIDWKMEPLHALYSQGCLPAINSLIDSGECMINRFFQKLNVRFINEAEIRGYDPLLRSFFNVNRPDELNDAIDRETIYKKGQGL
jgi:molybdenum cofactor guanylyltransferase